MSFFINVRMYMCCLYLQLSRLTWWTRHASVEVINVEKELTELTTENPSLPETSKDVSSNGGSNDQVSDHVEHGRYINLLILFKEHDCYSKKSCFVY